MTTRAPQSHGVLCAIERLAGPQEPAGEFYEGVVAMCLVCVAGVDPFGDVARRRHVLRLLSLIEHPDALPHDASLRLSRDIMRIIGPATGQRRCDSVMPDEAIGEGQ